MIAALCGAIEGGLGGAIMPSRAPMAMMEPAVTASMPIRASTGAMMDPADSLETLRMMVEGEFGYVDTILTIGCAMIFMKVIEDSGALDALSSLIIEKFHKVPARGPSKPT